MRLTSYNISELYKLCVSKYSNGSTLRVTISNVNHDDDDDDDDDDDNDGGGDGGGGCGDDDVVVVVADDDDNNNHTVKTLVSKYNTKGENSLNLFRITSNCISYHSWQ